MRGRYGWEVLARLALFKITVTALCFSARIPGGMFAPTLFTGAMIGGALGGLAQLVWPFPTSLPMRRCGSWACILCCR